MLWTCQTHDGTKKAEQMTSCVGMAKCTAGGATFRRKALAVEIVVVTAFPVNVF